MRASAIVLCLAATLTACGSDDDENYSETVSFPVSADTWSGGFPGVLEVSGTIDGTRTAAGSTRTVRVSLRFGGTGLNCSPKLTLFADVGGNTATSEINPPRGALEHFETLTLGTKSKGAAKLRVTLVESDCGPIGISMTDSKVTFSS